MRKKIEEKIRDIINNPKSTAKEIMITFEKYDRYSLQHLVVIHSLAEKMFEEIIENKERKFHKNLETYIKKYKPFEKDFQLFNRFKRAKRERNRYIHDITMNSKEDYQNTIEVYIELIEYLDENRDIKIDSWCPPRVENYIEEETNVITRGVFVIGLIVTFLSGIFLTFIFLKWDSFKIDDFIKTQPKIASGYKGSSYYATAQKIFKDVDILFSDGSIDNIKKLMDRDAGVSFGIVQADVMLNILKEAKEGKSEAREKLSRLKIVYPILKGSLHVFTQKDSNITTFKDLENHRIDISREDSGTAITAKDIFRKSSYKYSNDFNKSLKHLFSKGLKDGVEAIVLMGKSPLPILKAYSSKNLKFINYTQSDVIKPYSLTTLTKKNYPNIIENPIRTLSLQSYLVTNLPDTEENVAIVNEVLKKIESYPEFSVECFPKFEMWNRFSSTLQGKDYAYEECKE